VKKIVLFERPSLARPEANLQIAMLRAARVPCGYRLVHITKECCESPSCSPIRRVVGARSSAAVAA
jgi:hypothetical protein